MRTACSTIPASASHILTSPTNGKVEGAAQTLTFRSSAASSPLARQRRLDPLNGPHADPMRGRELHSAGLGRDQVGSNADRRSFRGPNKHS
jgi:hypothetical protein